MTLLNWLLRTKKLRLPSRNFNLRRKRPLSRRVVKFQSYHAYLWLLIILIVFVLTKRRVTLPNSTTRPPNSSQIYQSARTSNPTTKERNWLKDSFRSLAAISRTTKSLLRSLIGLTSISKNFRKSRRKTAKLCKSESVNLMPDSLITFYKNKVISCY